ncbi:MAG: DUF1501 domain-containing protein [Acidobacteria bacterium]|nr:DUF1501 domain-containing protein [Acidobacteriota bacterium]
MSTESSRRAFLQSAGLGIGWLAAQNLLHGAAPHFPAKAKRVISLFMQGGPSQVDTFDPKPLLAKLHGQHPPESFGNVDFQNGKFRDTVILGSKRTFRKFGQSGLEVSDLFPHTAKHADELAVIRSCYHEGFTHSQAQFLINSGWPRIGRPSVGSWILYGLGSENQNLPGFVVLLEGGVRSGPAVYGNGFLPTEYQGTTFRPVKNPILNLTPPAGMDEKSQRDLLDTLRTINRRHASERNQDRELKARMESYELAFRMQMAAPEASDISSESEATKKLYGLDNPDPVGVSFASRCLMARRLAERGVRFVQVWSGNGMNETDWDGHIACDKNHLAKAGQTDQAVAGLLTDLKARGLLDSTLVIWGGEFGRSPVSDGGNNGAEGRDHNPYGFTIWMAGGGVKGGRVIGATDELGLRAVHDKVHLHDLHAAILGLIGLDHTRVTFPYLGRDFRLTDVGGDLKLFKRLTA